MAKFTLYADASITYPITREKTKTDQQVYCTEVETYCMDEARKVAMFRAMSPISALWNKAPEDMGTHWSDVTIKELTNVRSMFAIPEPAASRNAALLQFDSAPAEAMPDPTPAEEEIDEETEYTVDFTIKSYWSKSFTVTASSEEAAEEIARDLAEKDYHNTNYIKDGWNEDDADLETGEVEEV